MSELRLERFCTISGISFTLRKGKIYVYLERCIREFWRVATVAQM
jgi:hypothetical protein